MWRHARRQKTLRKDKARLLEEYAWHIINIGWVYRLYWSTQVNQQKDLKSQNFLDMIRKRRYRPSTGYRSLWCFCYLWNIFLTIKKPTVKWTSWEDTWNLQTEVTQTPHTCNRRCLLSAGDAFSDSSLTGHMNSERTTCGETHPPNSHKWSLKQSLKTSMNLIMLIRFMLMRRHSPGMCSSAKRIETK